MASIINASTSGAGGLIQTADSSGVLALQAAGTTIASVSGTGVAVTGNVSSTGTVADSLGTLRPLVSGTAVASTSGTSIDFTGIPSWVKRITVMFSGVSHNGTREMLVQVGTGGTPTTSGYLSIAKSIVAVSVSSATYTSAFILEASVTDTTARSGSVVISNISGNTWISDHMIASNATASTSFGGGSVTLSGVLDMVRITSAPTPYTFDAGSINIMYE